MIAVPRVMSNTVAIWQSESALYAIRRTHCVGDWIMANVVADEYLNPLVYTRNLAPTGKRSPPHTQTVKQKSFKSSKLRALFLCSMHGPRLKRTLLVESTIMNLLSRGPPKPSSLCALILVAVDGLRPQP